MQLSSGRRYQENQGHWWFQEGHGYQEEVDHLHTKITLRHTATWTEAWQSPVCTSLEWLSLLYPLSRYCKLGADWRSRSWMEGGWVGRDGSDSMHFGYILWEGWFMRLSRSVLLLRFICWLWLFLFGAQTYDALSLQSLYTCVMWPGIDREWVSSFGLVIIMWYVQCYSLSQVQENETARLTGVFSLSCSTCLLWAPFHCRKLSLPHVSPKPALAALFPWLIPNHKAAASSPQVEFAVPYSCCL